jgi:hypothetical protein
MRRKLQIIAFALSLVFVLRSQAQTAEPIFPKGELSTAKNHTGNIWLKELSVGDSTFDPTIAVATMVPAQSWIGMFIQEVRFCSSPRARVITRKGESPYR